MVALGKLISRNHRRYGGYIIHLGVVMLTLGIIGDAYFKQETQGTLTAGQSLSVAGYSLRFVDLKSYPGTDGREIVECEKLEQIREYDAAVNCTESNLPQL